MASACRGGRDVWPGGYGLEIGLDEWIECSRPSQLSASYCAWIQVQNVNKDSPGFGFADGLFDPAPYLTALNDIQDTIDRGGRVSSEKKQACMKSLIQTACHQNFTCGKWLFFFPPSIADECWERIARATAEGRLGCSAKIAPTQGMGPTDRAVCCAYVKDFSCRSEVKRVFLELETMGFIVTCGFKPDFLTLLGINTGNQWKLKPTIYSVKEVEQW